jgi:hypothetical protein
MTGVHDLVAFFIMYYDLVAGFARAGKDYDEN